MIQRIQSVWLLLAAVFDAITFRFPFYNGDWTKDTVPTPIDLNAQSTLLLTVVAVLTGALAFADVPVQRTALDLDRLIHERMRLGIVSALAVNEHLSFNDLKKLLQTTDGNLSVHARKLEEAGYVTCEKYFEGRVP